MTHACPICAIENRSIDGFDLITILGLMKEYNLQEIWRRYLAEGSQEHTISLYVQAERYFLELHVEKMHRIILSEKFNTNPFFMQQVIQRIIASHDHDLIIGKIRNQGIDTGDNPISLSCSLGNTIIDLIVNKNDPFPESADRAHGNTRVETLEKRPLDIYDLSSVLYLCQQNLTDSIFRRYGDQDAAPGEKPAPWEVKIQTRVGDYDVCLQFCLISTTDKIFICPPGNVSVSTIHKVLQRMNFRHSPILILKEFREVGLTLHPEQLEREFTLRRFVNNTSLTLDLKRL
jgi:hypothetical protein